jgi:high-affinity iron transporter
MHPHMLFAPFNRLFAALLLLAAVLAPAAPAGAAAYYQGMVDEIGAFYTQALESYRAGDRQDAKLQANAAYFEVFENLEGPIRINISANKNFLLEEEFVGIRKMIIAGEPVAAIEARVEGLMEELGRVVRVINGEQVQLEEGSVPIDPAWLAIMETIRTRLDQAQTAYVDDRTLEAKRLVQQAQFDGYKNSLLETAVRRHVSAAKDYRNNAAFSELIRMINDQEPDFVIEMAVSGLLDALRSDLPGLPLVDGVEPVRVAEELPEKDWQEVSDQLFAAIDQALGVYAAGSPQQAGMLVQDSYFDIFEASGMEARIGSRNAEQKAELERHFSLLVAQIKKGLPQEQLVGTVDAMRLAFAETVAMLGTGDDTPLALFVYSLLIILREGFEAILIISAILAYLIKTGHRDKVKTIYNGCLVALGLSVLTAILVKWVFHVSAAGQELLEGGTMLLAAVVLFSVSYWLISKAGAQKWSAYIKEKVSASLSSGSLRALWLAAFLAVYREGAETVLFYQALAGSASGSAGMAAIAGGFAVGCVLLLVLYLVMRFAAVKLPLKPFFIGTGALLYFMAFVFAGQGIMELAEGKVFDLSLVSWAPTVPILGIFPYWQSLVPQGLLLGAAVAGLALIARRREAAA